MKFGWCSSVARYSFISIPLGWLRIGVYLYDRSMGTLETPTPITCKEDLEDYIDFEEEDTEDDAD